MRRTSQVAVAVFAATACLFTGAGAGAGAGERSLVVATPSAVDLPLDPRVTTGAIQSALAGDLLFSRLYVHDETGRVVPHLVASDSLLVSGEDVVFRMVLREGVPFAVWDPGAERVVRGDELGAEDVAYTIRSILDRLVVGQHLDDLRDVEAARIVGPHTVELDLAAASPTLRARLTLPIVPAAVAGRLDPATAGGTSTFGTEPALTSGSGPYVLRDFRQGDVVLEHNPYYWNDEHSRGLPRIVIRHVPEPGARIVAIRTGEVDMCLAGFHADQWAGLVGDPDVATTTGGSTAFQFVGFNLRRTGSCITDPRVRRAIAHAIDGEALAGFLGGLAIPGRTFLSEGHWATPRDPSPIAFPYDPTEANRLLDEAGLSERDPETGYRRGARVVVSYATWRGFLFTILQSDLKKVGIEAVPRALEPNVFWEKVDREQDFEVLLGGGMYSDDPAIYEQYFTGAAPETFNAYGYANDTAARKLERARRELDPGARADLYGEAILEIHADLPVLVLFHFRHHLAWRTDLQGVSLHPLGGLLPLARVHR